MGTHLIKNATEHVRNMIRRKPRGIASQLETMDHYILQNRASYKMQYGMIYEEMILQPIVLTIFGITVFFAHFLSTISSKILWHPFATSILIPALILARPLLKTRFAAKGFYRIGYLLAGAYVASQFGSILATKQMGMLDSIPATIAVLFMTVIALLVKHPSRMLSSLSVLLFCALYILAIAFIDIEYFKRNHLIYLQAPALAMVMDFMMGFVIRYRFFFAEQQRTIKESSAHLARIFNTVGHAIFQVYRDERSSKIVIHQVRSKVFDDSFGYDTGPLLFEETILMGLNLPNDRKSGIVAVLTASIGDHHLTFEINSGGLPSEVTFSRNGEEHVFEVLWSPLCSQDGIVTGILISMTDVTSLRNYQNAAKARALELTIIQQLIAVSHESFLLFRDSAVRFIDDCEGLLAIPGSTKEARTDALKNIFINLHTIKGAARTLGFNDIAEVTHNAENRLSQIQHGATSMDDTLSKEIALVKSLIKDYSMVSKEKLNRDESSDTIHVSRSDLRSIVDQILLGARLQRPQVAYLMNAAYVPLKQLVDKTKSYLPSLSKDLDKPMLGLETTGMDDVYITVECYAAMSNALVHLVRNSMDHGIENREERVSKGKSESGSLIFTGHFVQTGDYILAIADDGRGLALGRISEIGVAKGLLSSGKPYNPAEIAELIFSEGFSTASQVTVISGRGVGMEAVRKFMKDLGGNLRIELLSSDASSGYAPFRFLITIPASHVRQILKNFECLQFVV